MEIKNETGEQEREHYVTMIYDTLRIIEGRRHGNMHNDCNTMRESKMILLQ